MKKILVVFTFVLLFFMVGCNQEASEVNEYDLFKAGLLAVELDGRWGYIDQEGEVAIPILYDDAGAFYKELAIVKVNEKVKLIDKEGEDVLNKTYDSLIRDENNGFITYKTNGKWGLMDETGNVLTDALYDEVGPFYEGLAYVISNEKFGFIDETGEVVISIIYQSASHFAQGLAAVKKDDAYGFIDKEGKVFLEFVYSYAYGFDDFGNAIVEYESGEAELYGLIKKSDKSFLIRDALEINGYGPLYAVEKTEGEFYLYKADGTRFNTKTYDEIWRVSGYYANVEDIDGDVRVLFREDGSEIISFDYYESGYQNVVSSEGETQILYKEDDKYLDIYTVDKQYRIEADELYQLLPEERFLVERDDKVGIITKSGDIILEFQYDELFVSSDGFIAYEVNGKIGIMNSEYETLINATYDSVNLWYNFY
jgi:hypothetical protein